MGGIHSTDLPARNAEDTPTPPGAGILRVMPYKIRTRPCADCGTVVTARQSATNEIRCINCSIKRACSNMREIANKRGPGYDRWLQGMANAVAREMDSHKE